jgi:hypothetical protein
MNHCAKIKECPASQYLLCEAWLEGLECWEIASPRCSAGLRLCLQYGCPVYERYTTDIEAALKDRAMESTRSVREGEEPSA